MILADKIINLRKKEGMTQEDLAKEIGVSRQSVSKWEASMSMPDLDKVMKLSNIFGVSTDFLLNDDMGMENIIVDETGTETSETIVDINRLNEYYDAYKDIAKSVALGIPLLILSPIPILALENQNENLGVILTMVMVAVAVAVFIHSGFASNKVEFIEKEPYSFSYGVEGVAKKNLDEYMPTLKRNITISVMLYILSPMIYLIADKVDHESAVINIVFLILIALATSIITYTMITYSSYRDMLAYRDPRKQKKENKLSKFSGILWVLTIGIYLAYSFFTNNWSTSWIIFVIAGVIQVCLGIFFD